MRLLVLAAVLLAASFFAGLLSASEPAHLTDRDITRIKEFWPDYIYAARKVGVPVPALPAIHYREADLFLGLYSAKRKKANRNIGGPFMLDPGGGKEFARRIRDHEIKIWKLYYGAGKAPTVSRNFRFAAVVAAHELKSKLRCEAWTYECLVDAVWGYNGRASWTPVDENPYLWSNPSKNTQLIFKYRNRQGELVSFVDKRPGVMVVYSEILTLMKAGVFGP